MSKARFLKSVIAAECAEASGKSEALALNKIIL